MAPMEALTEDLGPLVHSVAIALLIIVWMAVGLRYYVRIFMVKSFGLDDWFATITLVSPPSCVCNVAI